MAELARHTSIPIAASERLATRQIFKQLIDRRAASVIMIDLAWCGGISRGAQDRQHGRGERTAGDAARLHRPDRLRRQLRAVGRRCRNVNYQEAVRAYFSGWYREIVDDLAAGRDGHVAPLEGPGLGLACGPSSSNGQTRRSARTRRLKSANPARHYAIIIYCQRGAGPRPGDGEE